MAIDLYQVISNLYQRVKAVPLDAKVGIFSGLMGLTITSTNIHCGGDEPDNITYNFGNAQNASCEEGIDYLISCNELHEDRNDALEVCYEMNLPQTLPQWFTCIYNADCDGAKIRSCHDMIDK